MSSYFSKHFITSQPYYLCLLQRKASVTALVQYSTVHMLNCANSLKIILKITKIFCYSKKLLDGGAVLIASQQPIQDSLVRLCTLYSRVKSGLGQQKKPVFILFCSFSFFYIKMFFCKNIVCILHTKLCIECHPYILLSCIKPYARFGQHCPDYSALT